jgi:hypothetical protein
LQHVRVAADPFILAANHSTLHRGGRIMHFLAAGGRPPGVNKEPGISGSFRASATYIAAHRSSRSRASLQSRACSMC